MSPADDELWVNLVEVKEIELTFLRRAREMMMGEHLSVFRGAGFNYLGLRPWEPGDKITAVDWPQSSLKNFDPLLIREFEENRNTTVLMAADSSLSMRCGTNDLQGGRLASQTIATIGLSATFFRDPFGVIVFDGGFSSESLSYVKPRTGRAHVVYCLRNYQFPTFKKRKFAVSNPAQVINGCLTQPSMVLLVSDFLFPRAFEVLKSLQHLRARHDIIVLVLDSASFFRLPDVSSGWVQVQDVESGRRLTLSQKALEDLPRQIYEHQQNILKTAKDYGLGAVLLKSDQSKLRWQLMDLFLQRKQHKKFST